MSAARSVEPTMSVKRTVASTRSGSGAGRTPVRICGHNRVAGLVQDEGRHADGRQHVPDVDFEIHAKSCDGGTGACGHPLIAGPPLPETLVAGSVCREHRQIDPQAPILLRRIQPTLKLFFAGPEAREANERSIYD